MKSSYVCDTQMQMLCDYEIIEMYDMGVSVVELGTKKWSAAPSKLPILYCLI